MKELGLDVLGERVGLDVLGDRLGVFDGAVDVGFAVGEPEGLDNVPKAFGTSFTQGDLDL